jgi:hypothetical protein
MKRSNFFFGLATVATLGYAAVPAGAVAPLPNESQTGWTKTDLEINARINNNNPGTVYYFFLAKTNNSVPASDPAPDTGGGTIVYSPGVRSTNTGDPTPDGLAINGTIVPVKSNTDYWIFAKTCPSPSSADAGCSAWVRISATAIRTNALQSDPGYGGLTRAGGSVPSPTSMVLKLVNPRYASYLQVWSAHFTRLVGVSGDGTDSGLLSRNFGSNTTLTVDDSFFSSRGSSFRLLPNRKYLVEESVEYNYSQVTPELTPAGGASVWMTPVNPGAVTHSNVTHCSADITAQNASTSLLNPDYTRYRNCAGSVCGTATAIGTDGVVTVNVIGLTPGASYTANSTALVGNGTDATANVWSNSGTTSEGSSFNTLSWGSPVGTVTNITNNSAEYTVTGINNSGNSILRYQLVLDGANYGAEQAWTGGSGANVTVTFTLSSPALLPNRQYTVGVKLIEASCPSPALALKTFTTDPNVPATFSLTANNPYQMTATWAVNSNPSTTKYLVEYCTPNLAGTCRTKESGAGATSLTLTQTDGVAPNTTYEAHVRAQTVGGGDPSAYSNSDTATTPSDVKNITILEGNATMVTGNSKTFTARVTDPSGNVIPNQTVTWILSNSNATRNPATGVTTSVTANLPGTTTLSARLSGYTDATVTLTIIAAGAVLDDGPNVTLDAPRYETGTVSARGHDNVAHQVTFTWFATGPAPVQFDPTQTTAADNVPATSKMTFVKAGTYQIKTTLMPGVEGSTTTVVPQVLDVMAAMTADGRTSENGAIVVRKGEDLTLVAKGFDQFGDPMDLTDVTWSSTDGSSGAGVSHNVRANTLGTPITYTATSGSKQARVLVTMVDFDLSAAKAFPVPFKGTQHSVIHFTGLGTKAKIRIYTTSGLKVFEKDVENQPTWDWDVVNQSNEKLASGVYLYLIESPESKKDGKLIIVQ